MKGRTSPGIVWAAAAVLWMLFIWSNSLQTAAESSGMSQGVLDRVLPFLALTGLSEDVLHTLVRKAAHMTEFAILGMLWSVGLRKNKPAFAICLLTAMTDETIQYFVPGRSCEVRDVCIDAAGAALGIVAAYLFQRVMDRRKN